MKKIDLLVMKKRSFIFYSVLVMVVAGCSGDVAPIEPVQPDNVIDQEIYSDVPIEFGYGGMTKAPLKNLEDATKFGLFSVKQGTTNLLNQQSDMLFWNQTLMYERDYGFKFYENEKKEPKQLIYYYPKSDDKYSFYAYYTRQDNKLVTPEIDAIKTTHTKAYVKMYAYPAINGTKRVLGDSGDVLWAKAESVDPDTGNMIDAFNFATAREKIRPSFTFHHPMSMLSFSVELKEELSRDLGKHMIRVDQIKLMNSPSEADLCVIDLEPDESRNMEGKFENIKLPENESQAPFLRGEDESRNLACELWNEDRGIMKILGRETMLVVPQKDPIVCRITFSTHANGTTHSGNFTYDIVLDPRELVETNSEFYNTMEREGCFISGCRYKFNIIVDFHYNTSIQKAIPKVKGTLVQ